MKTKILLFSIVLATLSQISLAQDKKFNFGFKVGPSISWFSIDERGISSEGAVPKLNWGLSELTISLKILLCYQDLMSILWEEK